MSTKEQFSQVLWDWTAILMRRSIHEFMGVMRKSGLSMPQLSVLMRLYFNDMCGVTDIGSYVGFTNAAASQMVDRLVNMGLLERTEDPVDRRVKNITLTQKGRDVIQQIINIRHRWMEELTQALTQEEQQSISKAIIQLSQAAGKVEN